ncbi:MAG: hypothetical protein Kow0098_10420 [Ignavibacteriaceae bacterium]
MNIKLLIFSLILSANFFYSAGQNQIDAATVNSEFNLAVNLYDSGQLNDAAVIFRKIAFDFKFNSKTTASIIFLARTAFLQNSLKQADQIIDNFLKNFPGSKFRDEARLLKARILIAAGDHLKAFQQLLFIIAESENSYYLKQSRSVAEKTALNYLTTSLLNQSYINSATPEVQSFLLLLIAKKHLLEANRIEALRALSVIKSEFPSSLEKNEAEELENLLLSGNTNSFNTTLIGVMLPLTDISAGNQSISAAGEILEGIKFAVWEFNKSRDDKIGILIRDTRNDEETIKVIKEEFISNDAVKCILGPVFSDEVRTLLKALEDEEIAVISPTATDEDLVRISRNFFQANPSLESRGKIMAQYLYYVENLRNVAIINSIDGYSPLIASGFRTEFEKLGGKVPFKITYKSGVADFGNSLIELTLNPESIEGIYIPLADKTDAPIILSELVKNELKLPVYGNQDWLLAKGFETSTELSNKITFTSDYFIDYNDPVYNSLSNQFINRTGSDLNRNVLYGYDTAKYLLTVLRSIDRSRRNIITKMESGIMSTGVHNNIAFDQNHSNKFLNIIRYKDGIFQLIDKFRSGN